MRVCGVFGFVACVCARVCRAMCGALVLARLAISAAKASSMETKARNRAPLPDATDSVVHHPCACRAGPNVMKVTELEMQ